MLKGIPFVRVACTLFLALLLSSHPVVGSITAGMPVTASIDGVTILQLFCTGAIAATKPTSPVSFASSLVSASSGNSVYSVMAGAGAGNAAMLGPVGTMLLINMYSGTAMSSGKLVAFAPLVEDFATSKTNDVTTNTNVPQVYFTLPRTAIVALSLMVYYANMEQLADNVWNVNYNDDVYYLGMGMWGVVKLSSDLQGTNSFSISETSFSQSNYEQIQAKAAFYVFGLPTNNAAPYSIIQQFINAIITDPVQVARNTTLALSVEAGYAAWSQYRNAGSTKLLPSNVITVAPVPGMDSTEYAASQAFAELRAANFASVTGNNDLNYVMTGWMSGMALIQALTMLSTNNFNSNGAMDNFYTNIGAAQSHFLVYDMVTGPLGTSCPTMAVTQGAMCCQTSGRNLFYFQMGQVSGGYDWTLMKDHYTYPKEMCPDVFTNSWAVPAAVLAPQSYHIFGQAPTDNDMMTYMCGQVQAVIRAMANTTLYGVVTNHSYRIYCQTTTMTNAATDLTNFKDTFHVDALSGAVADALVGSQTTGFTLDFIPQTTQPALTASNLFYLFPTLEQELYQMAAYLYSLATPPTKVCGVVQTSSSSTAIKTLLTNTLSTFSLPFSASNVVVLTSGTLTENIPAGCTDTFVIGLDDGDVAALVSYLQEHSSSSVYISFDDLTKYYDQFQSQSSLQQASGLAGRLVFATNLPSWTATPSASSSSSMSGLTTYEEFLQSVDTSLHTPAALRTFFAVSMFDYITAGSSSSLPDLQTAMYSKSVVSIGGLAFGPYLSSGATLSGESSSSTSKNYGAQEIGVWSYSRVVDPTTPLLMAPSTPLLTYISTGTSAKNEFVSVHEMIAYATATSQNCVDFEESSSGTTEGWTTTATTTLTTTTTEAPQTTTPSPRDSNTQSSSDAPKDKTMNVLMTVLAIIAALAWAAVLVVWLGQRFPRAVPRWTWFQRDPRRRIRSVCGRNASGEMDLRERSSDAARAPQQGSVCTLTVVDMPDAWQRWASAPVSMRRDTARFVKIVRQAIVDHQCYEVRVVCGTFVIACPSSSDAIALVRTLANRGVDARTTEVRMALHTLSCTSSRVTQDRGWWCGDEAARIVLSLCGQGETGQVLVTKATLDALGGQSETPTMEVTPCTNLRVNLQGSMELFSLPLLTHKTTTVSEYTGRCSTALMIASVQGDKACHIDLPVRVVKEVMMYHYRFLGSDVQQLDQARMSSDFAPGAGPSVEQQQLLCIDRVSAILVWKHNDMSSLWGNSAVPIIQTRQLDDGLQLRDAYVTPDKCSSRPLLPRLGDRSPRPIGVRERPKPQRRYRQLSRNLRHFSYADGNVDDSSRNQTASMADAVQ